MTGRPPGDRHQCPASASTPMTSPRPAPPSPLSYRDSGVDIDAGDALVERIKPFAARTMRPEVLAGIGGFGALVELPNATASRCSSPAPTAWARS